MTLPKGSSQSPHVIALRDTTGPTGVLGSQVLELYAGENAQFLHMSNSCPYAGLGGPYHLTGREAAERGYDLACINCWSSGVASQVDLFRDVNTITAEHNLRLALEADSGNLLERGRTLKSARILAGSLHRIQGSDAVDTHARTRLEEAGPALLGAVRITEEEALLVRAASVVQTALPWSSREGFVSGYRDDRRRHYAAAVYDWSPAGLTEADRRALEKESDTPLYVCLAANDRHWGVERVEPATLAVLGMVAAQVRRLHSPEIVVLPQYAALVVEHTDAGTLLGEVLDGDTPDMVEILEVLASERSRSRENLVAAARVLAEGAPV